MPVPNFDLNSKHKHLELEHLKVGVPFAFTFSPKDLRDPETKRCNTVRTLPDYGTKHAEFRKLFARLHSCTLELFPELDRLGRLHYHGTIIIHDIFRYMWHDLWIIQEAGGVKVDELNDPDVWYLYCTKQCHVMKDATHAINENYPFIVCKTEKELDPIKANIMRYTGESED